MFAEAEEKLKRAGYFLNILKIMAKRAGGFSYIKDQSKMRANLDGFFFEVISAKDFFLQGINDRYNLNLSSRDATDISKLKRAVCDPNILEVLKSIEERLSNRNSWLWKVNNYRNSTTHRELLHVGTEVQMPLAVAKTYLFEDPEDPSKGNADMEVIPYCEQSIQFMHCFLEKLYSQLPTIAQLPRKRSKVKVIALQYAFLAFFILVVFIFAVIWCVAFGRSLQSHSSELIREGLFWQSLAGLIALQVASRAAWKLPPGVGVPGYLKFIDRHEIFIRLLPLAIVIFLAGVLFEVVASFMLQ